MYLPPSDVIVIAGLSSPVLPLSAWLVARTVAPRYLHVCASVQALPALKATAAHAGLPPLEALHWHGGDMDACDPDVAQRHFHDMLAHLLARPRRYPVQLVIAGGTNWMVSLASQLAALHLNPAAGDALWGLQTDPRFENHPHYLRPDGEVAVIDRTHGVVTGRGVSRLLPLLLAGRLPPAGDGALYFDDTGLVFRGVRADLPPLQLSFYRWLLAQTKLACTQPARPDCEGCSACAAAPKALVARAVDFQAYYERFSAKPGCVRPAQPAEFMQRAAETVSKLNAGLRRQLNDGLYAQLRVRHEREGYLPGVDKRDLPDAARSSSPSPARAGGECHPPRPHPSAP